MPEPADILVLRESNVGIITLNRPAQHNAYTPDMGDQLIAAFQEFAADKEIGAILLCANGSSFCGGADKAFLAGKRSQKGLLIGQEKFINGFALELFQIEKPTVAAIQGAAIGLGATMTLSLDVRIASTDAVLGFPFSRLGLMPGMGSTCLLAHLVGMGHAKDIFLNALQVDSAAALDIGLVQRVVDTGKLRANALDMARALAENDPAVMAAQKCALNAPILIKLEKAIEGELQAAVSLRKIKIPSRK